MKKILPLLLVVVFNNLHAQKVDSIYFHLYTDSLKKERHNYINVDGKLSNGRYLPLSSEQVTFSCNTGHWEGNDLIIDNNYAGDSVVVTATLKADTAITKRITIYIKKSSYEGKLVNEQDIINPAPVKKQNRRN